MKITIAYLPEEEQKVSTIRHFVAAFLRPVTVHETVRHPPFKHVYIATKKPEKRCDSKEIP